MRHVLLHYHIFKNAGSSVDALLREAFGERHLSYDPKDRQLVDGEGLRAAILARPDLRSLSTHQGRPPVPEIPGAKVYPVVFVRDPILRAASAYRFHRDAGVHPAVSFPEYVRLRLHGYTAIHDFQTAFLSGFQPADRAAARPMGEADYAAATGFLRALPAFGIVERFDDAMRDLAAWLGPVFPEIAWRPIHTNRGADGLATVEAIRDALGARAFADLCAANVYDARLYEEALRVKEEPRRACD